MQNEFANRQNMHLTVLGLLDSPESLPVWKDQKPTAFTTRAGELGPKITALTGLLAEQQAATTGFTADKARAKTALETLAHELGQALADWFEDQRRQADAAQIALSLTAWHRLRHPALLAKARLLHQHLTAALDGGPAALVSLAAHGLAPADATELEAKADAFERLIADPAAAIARRKALTAALRPKFREVGKLLAKMDRLVLRFRRTEAGTLFAATWQAARTIRDLGHSAPQDPADPATPKD